MGGICAQIRRATKVEPGFDVFDPMNDLDKIEAALNDPAPVPAGAHHGLVPGRAR